MPRKKREESVHVSNTSKLKKTHEGNGGWKDVLIEEPLLAGGRKEEGKGFFFPF